MKRSSIIFVFLSGALMTVCGPPPPPAEMGPLGASTAGDQSAAAASAEEGLAAQTSQTAPPQGEAAGAQEPEAAADQPIQIVPRITVAKPEGGESQEAAAEPASQELAEEGFDNEGFAYPETHFCIKESEILVYYLYEPGTHEGWLCELRFSHIPAHWHATAERNFCASKLAEHLRRAKRRGYTCYCARPGRAATAAQITDSGYTCADSGAINTASGTAKEALKSAIAAPPRQQQTAEKPSSSGGGAGAESDDALLSPL